MLGSNKLRLHNTGTFLFLRQSFANKLVVTAQAVSVVETHLGKLELQAEARLLLLLGVILVGMALAALSGCGYSASATATRVPAGLHGSVHGGQQPVNGASVQIYAAGTNGIASAAVPLLSTPVKTDNFGNFSVPTSFYCPSASSELYLVARGGDPGLSSGTDNTSLALMVMLGSCSSLSASSAISVNEATTVGSVWPLAAYMKSPSDLGSSAGDADFLTAVSTVNEFIDIANGSSPGISTPESYFAQNSKLYSLANVLDKCVNSPGGSAGDGSPCGVLFSIAMPAREVPRQRQSRQRCVLHRPHTTM